MAKVKFGDVVSDIKINIDRKNNPYKYYIAGDHMDTEDTVLHRRGCFLDGYVGPAFTRLFKPGQILYGSRRTYLKKVAIADFEGITSNTTFVLETKNDSVLSQRLLPFIMLSDEFTKYSISKSKGSTNPYILFSDLANYEFELPGREKQEIIADILCKANETLISYKNLIFETDELIKSQFIEMFGRLGWDDKGWGITTLNECCILNPRKTGGISDELMVSFLAMPSVGDNGHLDLSVTRPYEEVKKGFTYFAERDVLFAKITPCMENGKGAVAEGLSNGIGMGSTEFHVLRPLEGKSNPYWLYVITMFKGFRENARKVMTGTGGQLRVPISYLQNYTISLPPIELQNNFEHFYKQSDKSKFELQMSVERIKKTISKIVTEEFNA